MEQHMAYCTSSERYLDARAGDRPTPPPPNPLYTHRPKMGRFFERLVPLFFLLPQFRSSPSLSLDGQVIFLFFFSLPSSSRVPIFIQSALSPHAPQVKFCDENPGSLFGGLHFPSVRKKEVVATHSWNNPSRSHCSPPPLVAAVHY